MRKESGRVFVEGQEDFDYEEAVEALKTVFGITGICPMVIEQTKDVEHLTDAAVRYVDSQYDRKHFTFKVNARRGDKEFPMNSMDINCLVGEKLLDAWPDLKVDVHRPEVLLNIEVRQQIYIYSVEIPGPGGMPVGTNGKAMLLLSGGIDSPVAGYMIAKTRSAHRCDLLPCTSIYERAGKTESGGSGKDCLQVCGADPSSCGKLYGYSACIFMRSVRTTS